MLATLQPAAVLEPHDLAQYRPAKDIEAFNALLPPPIEFVEGSSSGTLAVAEGKYKPINGSGSGTPKSGKTEVRGCPLCSLIDIPHCEQLIALSRHPIRVVTHILGQTSRRLHLRPAPGNYTTIPLRFHGRPAL